MISRMDQINFLEKVTLFKNLSRDELESLASISEIRIFEKGDFLFQQNTQPDSIYLIYQGDVVLFVTTPYGEKKTITSFGKYDFLGEGSLMDDSPRSTSAKAEFDTTVLVLHNSDIRKIFKLHSLLSVKIFTQII